MVGDRLLWLAMQASVSIYGFPAHGTPARPWSGWLEQSYNPSETYMIWGPLYGRQEKAKEY